VAAPHPRLPDRDSLPHPGRDFGRAGGDAAERLSERPYERADVRRATGGAIRPGGLTLTERALDLLPFAAGSMLLDCGCGAGATLARLDEAGFCALGIDSSPVLAAEAAHKVPGRVLLADAGRLPLESAVFDGVFCECVLSALSDAGAALDEIARVLVPGGFLVLSDLYLRAGSPGCGGQGLGCAAGAVPRDVVEDRFLRHGLSPVLFEDHTKLLVDLSCRLVLELGSAREVLAVLTGREPTCDGSGEKPRLGYGLWISRKEVSA
jgi:SAM-dependent methyltransferase